MREAEDRGGDRALAVEARGLVAARALGSRELVLVEDAVVPAVRDDDRVGGRGEAAQQRGRLDGVVVQVDLADGEMQAGEGACGLGILSQEAASWGAEGVRALERRAERELAFGVGEDALRALG